MPTYMLRAIPPDIWRRVRARAEADGMPLRALMLSLLDRYGAGEIDVDPPALETAPPRAIERTPKTSAASSPTCGA